MILVDSCVVIDVLENDRKSKSNPHTGSRFDAFLKEEGIYDDVQVRAISRAFAAHVAGAKHHRNIMDGAARADVAMEEGGVGFAMPDVHRHAAAKVRGEQVKRPSTVKWRK